MIRIAVCDDNHKECFALEGMLREIAKEKSWKIKTHGYSNGEELYDAIMTEGMSFDIILLDIEMDKMNGIEFSRKLRNQLRDKMTKIVFISWEDKYALDLFSLRAHDFITKPLDKDKLIDSLLDAIELIEMSKKEIDYFYYKIGHNKFMIDKNEILYFSIDEKKVVMKTRAKGEIRFSGKISVVYEDLIGSGFFFSHNSYLVNHRNIESIRNTGITMINGEKIPVSRAHKDDIDEMLLKGRRKSRKDELKL
jgi:DNA-binding LytR/AlgR family response regulator